MAGQSGTRGHGGAGAKRRGGPARNEVDTPGGNRRLGGLFALALLTGLLLSATAHWQIPPASDSLVPVWPLLGFYVVYRFLRLGGARPSFKGRPGLVYNGDWGSTNYLANWWLFGGDQTASEEVKQRRDRFGANTIATR